MKVAWFSLLVLAVVVMGFERSPKIKEISPEVISPKQTYVALSGKKPFEAKDGFLKLDRDIQITSKKLEDINARLYSKGFPKILQNEHLSDVEREEIIRLLNQGSRIQVLLSDLKMKKIDAEFEGAL